MRFSHTADCHIGGHRNRKLRLLTERAFERFVTQSLGDEVDFCLIAGDLLNTAIPGIDALKFTVTQLGRLKEAGIPVYVIPGSHDYSPSGKSMLDVFERAGLLTNVARYDDGETVRLRYTTDPGTGVMLAGLPGRRGMTETELYERLQDEKPDGEAIFLFHTAVEGCGMSGLPRASLPSGFTYYAGGHVHVVKELEDNVVYPGPLFPNSFSELEELRHGGYWLYDDGELVRRDIELKPVVPITVDVDGRSSTDAEKAVRDAIGSDVKDAIVLVRITGTLSSGSVADIDLPGIGAALLERGAHAVLRNTAGVRTEEFTATEKQEPTEDLEKELIREHADQLTLENGDGKELATELLHVLGAEQQDGERQYEYEERVVKEAKEAVREVSGK